MPNENNVEVAVGRITRAIGVATAPGLCSQEEALVVYAQVIATIEELHDAVLCDIEVDEGEETDEPLEDRRIDPGFTAPNLTLTPEMDEEEDFDENLLIPEDGYPNPGE
jgi:hypothetical protein